jgi:hypothetical protein
MHVWMYFFLEKMLQKVISIEENMFPKSVIKLKALLYSLYISGQCLVGKEFN